MSDDYLSQFIEFLSLSGFMFLSFCILVIFIAGGWWLLKVIKQQNREVASAERSSLRRKNRVLYEKVRKELDTKISTLIANEEAARGEEYSGTDLIERINQALDEEDFLVRQMPVGDEETIARLKVIGDWRQELQRGLMLAISSVSN